MPLAAALICSSNNNGLPINKSDCAADGALCDSSNGRAFLTGRRSFDRNGSPTGAEMPVALAVWTTTLERILDAQRNLACADRAMAHNGYSNPSGCRRDGDCNPQETESIR